jgi:hypothetical protein
MTATTTTAQVQAQAQAPASLGELFQQASALVADVKARKGDANWLADEVDDESASLTAQDFECEINDDSAMWVSQDGEYLDFDVYGLDEDDEDGNEAPVSLGVRQVMKLRDLLNEFLALPVNAAAVRELEGAL